MKCMKYINFFRPFSRFFLQTKCEEYWPQHDSQNFGEILVSLKLVTEHPDCIIRTMIAEKVRCTLYYWLFKDGCIRTQNFSNNIILWQSRWSVNFKDMLMYVYHSISFQSGESRTVTQFHFQGWPDHGVPSSPLPLINLRHRVRDHTEGSTVPTLVHCR